MHYWANSQGSYSKLASCVLVHKCIKTLCIYWLGAPVDDEEDIDYVPSLFSYTKTKPATIQSKVRRYQRLVQRRKLAAVANKQKRINNKSTVIVEADSNVQQTVEVSGLTS